MLFGLAVSSSAIANDCWVALELQIRLVRSSAVATAQETRSRSLILSPLNDQLFGTKFALPLVFNCRANPPLKSLPTEVAILSLERGGAEGHAENRVLGRF